MMKRRVFLSAVCLGAMVVAGLGCDKKEVPVVDTTPKVLLVSRDGALIAHVKMKGDLYEGMEIKTKDKEKAQTFSLLITKLMEKAKSTGLSFSYHTYDPKTKIRATLGASPKQGEPKFYQALYTTLLDAGYNVRKQR